jgi:hypothetical protein
MEQKAEDVAIYQLRIQHYGRGKIASLAAHARYITRAALAGRTTAHANYLTREGQAGSREDLVHAEHGNLPEFAQGDAQRFWRAADLYGRINARVASEVLLTLPRELPRAQQVVAVREFVARHLPHYPYTWALHEARARDGGLQPHAHVQFSPRMLDGIERDAVRFFGRANSQHPERGGAPMDRSIKERDTLLRMREDWARILNRALEQTGREERVDHRSNAARGLERVPEPKLHWREARALAQLLARAGYSGRERHCSPEQIQQWKASGHITERMAIVLEIRSGQDRERRERAGQEREKARQVYIVRRHPGHLLQRVAAAMRDTPIIVTRKRHMQLDRERDDHDREHRGGG